MAQSPAAAVDHETDLSYVVHTHFLGSVFVEDLIDHLYLCIVVTSTKGAQLGTNKCKHFDKKLCHQKYFQLLIF